MDLAFKGLQDCKVQAAASFVRNGHDILADIRNNLTSAAASMKKYADAHRRNMDFNEEDSVWLKTDHLQLPAALLKKLAPKWIGPFRIRQRISAVAYRLDLPPKYLQLQILRARHPRLA